MTKEESVVAPNPQQELNEKLYGACQSGATAMAYRLIARGADVNHLDAENRITPLHVAAHCRRHEIVELLLQNGSNVDAIGDDISPGVPAYATWTPIMLCYDDVKMVTRLLSHGANPDFQDAREKTSALHMAARNNYVESVLSLLYYGARRDLVNREGRTPLEEARFCGAVDVVQAWETFELAEKAMASIGRNREHDATGNMQPA